MTKKPNQILPYLLDEVCEENSLEVKGLLEVKALDKSDRQSSRGFAEKLNDLSPSSIER